MVSPPDDVEHEESPRTADDRARAAAGSRRYRRAHKDEINARRRDKYWTDPEFQEREKGRARRISSDAYDLLFARQGGVCAIGKQKSDRRLHADHCHATGKLRGLLCSNCNTGLGLYHDDADRLLAAAAYLLASRCDPGTADAGSVAAEIVKRLHRRLEVHLHTAFRMAPRDTDWNPVAAEAEVLPRSPTPAAERGRRPAGAPKQAAPAGASNVPRPFARSRGGD